MDRMLIWYVVDSLPAIVTCRIRCMLQFRDIVDECVVYMQDMIMSIVYVGGPFSVHAICLFMIREFEICCAGLMSKEYLKSRGWGCYPDEAWPEGPVPPPLPVPLCLCGIPAMVKQSREPRTAGRAYFVCRDKYDSECRCYFFQWIDGQDKYDPRIRLFPYDEKELKTYNEFRRWVPPPPNPAPMTMEEKSEASCIRVKNPPLCHCGYPCKLQRPNIGVPAKFTPFFRCKLTTHVSVVLLCFYYSVMLIVNILS